MYHYIYLPSKKDDLEISTIKILGHINLHAENDYMAYHNSYNQSITITSRRYEKAYSLDLDHGTKHPISPVPTNKGNPPAILQQ